MLSVLHMKAVRHVPNPRFVVTMSAVGEVDETPAGSRIREVHAAATHQPLVHAIKEQY